MSALAWRWEAVKSYFSGKPPLVTKETARTSLGEYYYKNDKVKESLNYQFRPIKETIKDLASFYQQAQQAQQAQQDQ